MKKQEKQCGHVGMDKIGESRRPTKEACSMENKDREQRRRSPRHDPKAGERIPDLLRSQRWLLLQAKGDRKKDGHRIRV